MQIKCGYCEFWCDKEITMRKHIYTKNSNEETNNEGTIFFSIFHVTIYVLSLPVPSPPFTGPIWGNLFN